MQKGPPCWVALLTVLVPLTGIELVTFALRMRSFVDLSAFTSVDTSMHFSYFSMIYIANSDLLR